ncbi:hypothetical protein [Sorangium sp. So ce362]|uniref:hypothetical protein n=1 Tax=Sorangium sp. So ce362 TaxID=3133303 RepID=UPI003F5E4ED4
MLAIFAPWPGRVASFADEEEAADDVRDAGNAAPGEGEPGEGEPGEGEPGEGEPGEGAWSASADDSG